MSIKNRELSQFGSFVFIDDPTRKIAITTESTPFVGIGTTNPQGKLHVVGDTRIDGNLEFDGSLILDSVDVYTSGIITAASFYNTSNEQLVAFDSWETNNSDIYKLSGNVGIGVSVLPERLVVRGNVSATRFISTASNGTPPFEVSSNTEVTNLNASLLRGGVPGANINPIDIVTLGAVQTLDKKTLSLATITGAGITFNGSTSGKTTLKANVNAGDSILTLPTTSGTLVSTGDTGVITSNMIADLNITNSDVATGAGITYTKLYLVNSITNTDIASNANIDITKLSSRTISGVSLGSTLSSLTSGNFINFSSGSTYNGSSPITVSVAATSASSGNSIVSRNSSGDFSAGTISASNLTASQTVQSQNINVSNLVTALDGNFTGIVTTSSLSTFNLSSYGGTFSGGVSANTLNVFTTFRVFGTQVIDQNRNLLNINSLDSTVTSLWNTVGIGTTNKTIVNREYISVVSSGSSITLPANPSPGWEVVVGVDNFTNVTILRNGENIMGLAEDMTIDVPYASVNLLYVDSTRGWRII